MKINNELKHSIHEKSAELSKVYLDANPILTELSEQSSVEIIKVIGHLIADIVIYSVQHICEPLPELLQDCNHPEEN